MNVWSLAIASDWSIGSNWSPHWSRMTRVPLLTPAPRGVRWSAVRGTTGSSMWHFSKLAKAGRLAAGSALPMTHRDRDREVVRQVLSPRELGPEASVTAGTRPGPGNKIIDNSSGGWLNRKGREIKRKFFWSLMVLCFLLVPHLTNNVLLYRK